ncbi:hypothetical protein SAY86_031229 [Trapa natans]|uniref:Malectin-like domain-containing protein n=1 Tax=Trapa natans TaxID=22666 RepID=A0AAN7R831_TRANT|nr:hypothetical protein SAY86_031229 [Trapa natans]
MLQKRYLKKPPMDRAMLVFFAVLFGASSIVIPIQGQLDQSGFLSIDCGLPANTNYTYGATGISYVSDSTFIDTGVTKPISASYNVPSLGLQFRYVRSFPTDSGAKNCYTFRLTKGKKHLIRARFMYGNYDSKNQLPEFGLYLGVTLWDTVEIVDASKVVDKEIIHVASSNSIDLCIMDTGFGTPFISVIELRILSNYNLYESTISGSMVTYLRYDIGSQSTDIVRYRDDAYDRLWYPVGNSPSWKTISTTSSIGVTTGQNSYVVPSKTMQTAVTPTDPSQPLNFSLPQVDPNTGFKFYLHFSEIEQLQSNESRIFNITLNGDVWYGNLGPRYLGLTTIGSTGQSISQGYYNFSLVKVNNSTRPPLLNAIEAYTVVDILESQTAQDDAGSMRSIKSTYGLKNKNWQGDPCAPETYRWDGINCNYDNPNSSRIISLNLSSSGLTGQITPYIGDLKSLGTLDLSYNNLTGGVPDFLAQLPSLKVLLDGNPYLCSSTSCQNGSSSNGQKHANNLGVAIGASLGSLLVIIVAGFVLFFYLKVRPTKQQSQSQSFWTFGSSVRKFFF